jgi:hypothetical protein
VSKKKWPGNNKHAAGKHAAGMIDEVSFFFGGDIYYTEGSGWEWTMTTGKLGSVKMVSGFRNAELGLTPRPPPPPLPLKKYHIEKLLDFCFLKTTFLLGHPRKCQYDNEAHRQILVVLKMHCFLYSKTVE